MFGTVFKMAATETLRGIAGDRHIDLIERQQSSIHPCMSRLPARVTLSGLPGNVFLFFSIRGAIA
jgi:hypothetical protein